MQCSIVVRQCSYNNGADLHPCAHMYKLLHASTHIQNGPLSKETDFAHILHPVVILS